MPRGHALPAAFAGLLLLCGCGGQPQLSQEEHFDIVECSAAAGNRPMPRKLCEQQGGMSMTPVPYRGPGPYNAPTIEQRRAMGY